MVNFSWFNLIKLASVKKVWLVAGGDWRRRVEIPVLPGDGDCWAHWRSSLRGQGGFANMQIHLNYQNGIFKIRKGSVNTNKMGPGSPVAGPRFVTARISRVGNASCSRQRPLAVLLCTTGRHVGQFTLNLILCANMSLSTITNN